MLFRSDGLVTLPKGCTPYIKKMFVINHKGERIEGDAFDVNLAKENKKPLEKRQLPVFVAEVNGETKYILPVYRKGLWGPI